MVVEVVFVLGGGVARRDELRGAGRLVGGDEADLGGGGAGREEEDGAAAARAGRAGAEQLVLLLVDERVLRLRVAERVAPDLVRALGVVFGDVEERLVVGRPEGRDDLAELVREVFARAQVFDLEDVLAVAVVVDGVGQQVRVVRDRVGRHRGVVVPLVQLVEVERDLLGRGHRALAARVDRVLLALDGARVVEVAVLAVGHLRVGLLDATEHLFVELGLQVGGRLHHGVGVGVLGFEVRGHVRVGLLAHPEVVVHQLLAVNVGGLRCLLRRGRRRERACRHRVVGLCNQVQV